MDQSASLVSENQGRQLWPLTSVLVLVGAIDLTYLLVVQAIRIYMRNREPFKLKTVLFYYNSAHVILSAYLMARTLQFFYAFGINSIGCVTDVLTVEWMNYFLHITDTYNTYKHIDLLDTIFFALRKKDNQITFLHVYHHCIMVGWGWLTSLFCVSDHYVVAGFANTTVHFFMYTYYLIASLGPDYAKYIWWKKHLTKLQLIQFVGVVSHLTYQQMMTSCPVPWYVFVYTVGNLITFFLLFLNFYFKSYISKNKDK